LVHCDDPPANGALVRVKCGSGTLPARVAWVSGKRFGIAFAAPLSDAQLSSLFIGQARGSHVVGSQSAAA